MANISIGCMNCRGLSADPIKRRDFFLKCRNKYDISLLIDTHSNANSEVIWKHEWVGTVGLAPMPRTAEG